MTKGLKLKVEEILKRYPEARDDDARLLFYFYEEYYFLSQTFTAEKMYEVFKASPADDIIRFRRHIQNKEYRYLPTSEEVMHKRRMNIDKCREILGYQPQPKDTL